MTADARRDDRTSVVAFMMLVIILEREMAKMKFPMLCNMLTREGVESCGDGGCNCLFVCCRGNGNESLTRR